MVCSNVIVGGGVGEVSVPAIWPGLGWQVQYNVNPGCVTLTVTVRVRLASYDLLAEYYGVDVGSELEDANRNGIANLLEGWLGNDPTTAVYRAATTHGGSNGWFPIRFTRNTDAVDLSYFVEAENVLTGGGDWSCILSNVQAAGWLGPARFTETALSNGVVEVVVTDIAPAATNRFLRVRVARP